MQESSHIDADIRDALQDFLKMRKEMTLPQHNSEILKFAKLGRDALNHRYPTQAAIRLAKEYFRHIINHSEAVKEKAGE